MKTTDFRTFVHTALALGVAAILGACGTVGRGFTMPHGIDPAAGRRGAT